MSTKKENQPTAPASQGKAPDNSVYADLFENADQFDFERIADVDGVDAEIELLRYQIRKVIEGEPNPDLRLIIQATNAIERLVRTRHHVGADNRRKLKEAFKVIMRDIALPLGLTFGHKAMGE